MSALKGQSGDTSSEGTSSEDDDDEAYTTEEVGRYEFDLWDVEVNIIKKTFPPQPPQEGKFGKLIVPYDIFDNDLSDDGGSMPSQRAGRPKDDYWHEAMDEDCSEDENSLPSLFDPNEKDDTTYGVLDDFFDKFSGGTSKTKEDNAALMADEEKQENL